MTFPSNSKFYEWGNHSSKGDSALPLTDQQKQLFQRIITTNSSPVSVNEQIVASGEGFLDPNKFYRIAQNTASGVSFPGPHLSSPALYPHSQASEIERGNYYYSSGNFTLWPNPNGQAGDDDDRYSAYWWDVSGIYFSPDIYNEKYYAYPTLPDGNAASIFLFDELDHDLYSSTGDPSISTSKKYLLWINQRNLVQFGIFNYGSKKGKTIQIPLGYDEDNNKTIYKDEIRDYYYSHFSNGNHDALNGGVEDFQLFTTYVHYIPRLKSASEDSHGKVQTRLDRLNEIPFLANTKSVYLYSVYGLDNTFIPILRSPGPPFPPAERPDGEVESKDSNYHTQEELDSKFSKVSGLLGL